MVKLLLAAFTAFIGLALVIPDADARRMGGGRSMGSQRQALPPQTAPKPPAQQQAAPASTPAQQPSAASRWLGPLAGLALGAGLAALFLNNGLAGALGGLLMIAALVAAGIFIVRMLRQRSPARPMQYAAAGNHGTPPPATPLYGGGTPAPHSVAATLAAGGHGTSWPADFDAEAFARNAKLNFVRLQTAHSRGDLSELSDFLSPELFSEIEADIKTHGASHTDVVTLNAEVIDVVIEDKRYIVSVRFSGMVREALAAEPQAFSEVWHLEKPVSGMAGWQLAGIQQD